MNARNLESEADIVRIAELIYAYPDQFNHIIDLPYRLSSWSVQNPDNVCLWEDEYGRLHAFAIMQEPFLTLDYGLYPETASAALEVEIVRWANQRAPQVASEQGSTFPYHLFCRDESADQTELWQTEGLARTEYADNVFMHRSLADTIKRPELPHGFSSRPLQGKDEVPQYVRTHQAAFNSTNMRENWRYKMLTMPQYRPELDQVIVNDEGRIAALVIGWLHPDGQQGCLEPLGVHPDFQQLGLGTAVLRLGLTQLQQQGAKSVTLFTGADNETAIHLYKKEGFTIQFHEIGYGRLFFPQN